MALALREVHVYEKLKDKDEWRLTKTQTCLRLRGKDAPCPLFVQGGVVYAEGGEVIGDPPEWFWKEARKCTPQARAEVGLVLPEEREVATPPAPPLAKGRVGGIWSCPECGEEMATRQKGAHVMRHRRAAKKTPPESHLGKGGNGGVAEGKG